MAEKKEAVDSKAKEYWSKYFGPYGKQWTEDVLKRVAAALDGGEIRPVGWAKAADGGLVAEFLHAKGESRKVVRAEFSPDGVLRSLEVAA